MQGIAARGYHSAPMGARARPRHPGAHVARAAGYLMQAQMECGTLCPTTMTYGAIAAMRRDPGLARDGCRGSSRANTIRATSPSNTSAAA